MKLPDAVEVSPALALEMARRNGLRAVLARPMPHQGMINTVIALDDQFVLKVPRAHPATSTKRTSKRKRSRSGRRWCPHPEAVGLRHFT